MSYRLALNSDTDSIYARIDDMLDWNGKNSLGDAIVASGTRGIRPLWICATPRTVTLNFISDDLWLWIEGAMPKLTGSTSAGKTGRFRLSEGGDHRHRLGRERRGFEGRTGRDRADEGGA